MKNVEEFETIDKTIEKIEMRSKLYKYFEHFSTGVGCGQRDVEYRMR